MTPDTTRLEEFSRPLEQMTMPEIMAERRELDSRLVKLSKEISHNRSAVDALHKISSWMKIDPPILQANDCSRLHKLADYAVASGVLGHEPSETVLFKPLGVFVVSQDWHALIGQEVGSDFILPYPHCAFEFMISGRPVIVMAMQHGEATEAQAFVEQDGHWLAMEEDGNDIPATMVAWNQVCAICVALDAEVVTQTPVRAPHKLNERRVKEGKTPLASYTTIDLRRRVRVSGLGTSDGSRKRLHFRRGHWRHYEDHKTWIRWTLVGDPHLGFVDQRYSA